ncbi:glycosyltransferase [Companilactobacillus mishanensis]|uniref:Glycosyltransferase n=1 Tax=Companilactobacillus mishanensis TaxID=2486008 RepID=A0ABW9P8K1_9LACO|nr:glycosyltransferase [Companilactobacillus mishanensis]MQS45429.1 glycosyltransferase [Companilactobacillus mishanensis]
MKKIQLFIPYMTGFGGTETVISNLYSEYKKIEQKDYQLKVTSIGGYKNGNWLKKVDNKHIIWLTNIPKVRFLQYLLLLPFILFNEVKKDKPDVVISTEPFIWFLLYVIKKITRSNYKVMSWYHFSLSIKKIRKFLIKPIDGHLAISTGISRQIINLGISPDKVKVIFNPIMRKEITVRRTENAQPCKFAYVGRIMLDGQKNMRSILNCLSQIESNWTLDVFGSGNNAEVKNYAEKLGISNKVHFQGFQVDVWSNMDTMDCLLMTSRFEGLPMVLNEAISVGIPVMSFNCSTGPSDIINDKNGVLVPDKDEASFVKGLQKFTNREICFQDTSEIKNSISKFYSDNYFLTFIKAIQE